MALYFALTKKDFFQTVFRVFVGHCSLATSVGACCLLVYIATKPPASASSLSMNLFKIILKYSTHASIEFLPVLLVVCVFVCFLVWIDLVMILRFAVNGDAFA